MYGSCKKKLLIDFLFHSLRTTPVFGCCLVEVMIESSTCLKEVYDLYTGKDA